MTKRGSGRGRGREGAGEGGGRGRGSAAHGEGEAAAAAEGGVAAAAKRGRGGSNERARKRPSAVARRRVRAAARRWQQRGAGDQLRPGTGTQQRPLGQLRAGGGSGGAAAVAARVSSTDLPVTRAVVTQSVLRVAESQRGPRRAKKARERRASSFLSSSDRFISASLFCRFISSSLRLFVSPSRRLSRSLASVVPSPPRLRCSRRLLISSSSRLARLRSRSPRVASLTLTSIVDGSPCPSIHRAPDGGTALSLALSCLLASLVCFLPTLSLSVLLVLSPPLSPLSFSARLFVVSSSPRLSRSPRLLASVAVFFVSPLSRSPLSRERGERERAVHTLPGVADSRAER